MTIKQQPTTPWGAYDKLIYRFEDATNVSQPKYRFIAKVFWKSQLKAVLKVLPNANDEGIFEISRIVQDQLFADTPFNTMSKETAANMSGKLYVQYGYEYAPDADSAPTETTVGTTSTIDVLAGNFVNEWNDSNVSQVGSWVIATGTKFALSVYPHESTTGSTGVLKDYYQKIQSKDYATITVLEQNQIDSITTDFYDSSGSLLYTHDHALSASDVGANDSALHIGTGPENYIYFPSTTAYYRVTASTGATVTLEYWYLVEEECKHEALRVAWWNKYGGIDYLNFYAASTESRQIKNHTYRTYGGNFLTASSSTDAVIKADEGLYSAGQVQVTRKISANTGYVPEYMVDVIADLVQSPRVWAYRNQSWQSVKVDTSSVEMKTSLIDKAIDYKIDFEFAKYGNAVG